MQEINPYDYLKAESFIGLKCGFVNSMDIDNTVNRFLLCGGADSSIAVVDLDSGKKVADVPAKTSHQFGVSKVLWWPLDNGLFVTGSFDKSVKIWDADAMEPAYSFDTESKVYNLDLNDKLIALGMDHPYIRLIDPRSGSFSHVLKGHEGKVLSVKWSPENSNYLASAGSDGTVRVWDIRNARPLVESLDMMRTSESQSLDPLDFRRAHRAAVNGLSWTPCGDQLVSIGSDNKARVWNLNVPGGINQGVNFGPQIQNRFLQNSDPLICMPFVCFMTDSGTVLLCELETGKIHRQLQPLLGYSSTRQACLARSCYDIYSGDGEGNITLWTAGVNSEPPDVLEDSEEEEEDNVEKAFTVGDFL